jgi:hypothetical protein
VRRNESYYRSVKPPRERKPASVAAAHNLGSSDRMAARVRTRK